MEILRVEPTPSPNTMKIVLSNKREDNKSNTFTYIDEQQPQFINDLLTIDGVKSIFYVMDFLAIDKEPKSDWEVVLPQITSTLNNESFIDSSQKPDEHYGEIKAEALMFKGIPYQIKLTTTSDESRKQLPDYFVESMLKAQKDGDNVVFLRKWQDLGVRYGDLEEVMNEVYEETIALYPSEKLASLVQTALETDIVIPQQQYHHVTLNEYKEATDWKDKLRMLKEFPTPTLQDIDLLDEALQEDKAPLRRQAIVLIGMIEDKEILPYLYKGLHDKSPAVRRTAGDCLSDLGYKEALPEMEKALNDSQKIVRWRAAMFLFDEGGPEQLPSLKSHANDPAYEVKLQIEMAISRIENGDEALGSVWKQIANRNK
ncbi:conserved virulence factor C family protein [Staphylococcus haemolyticus]|uniref:conserved virulence factor C family protein n=1 Tax=Staphylococcus haemolyticus TaxID=1283 RepID=UPI00051CC882|nr:conserved virulence factor C family protein [Staphylococcus haemolyticus]KGJ25507.1 virulence factor [Staphylococcus haemolyticus]KGJ29107.1 virulence factor [Staphylococcus haemolyticus]MCH4326347.1 conserved virulence factor C family protein [Staphylococcus haemolyticus]MCH4415937.1 conserved virulence factor C family protein [Staphylococcus haemolyticus]MCH4418935.1 conserved virulence factor C family protein [Staphylococcus haemolyticus]